MLKCLRRILEMRGSAGLYVTTNGTTSLGALGLVDFFAKAQEARELIKNCELSLYVSRDGLSHCTKIIISR